jgi:ferredoxin-thioredoxin reductase catalytic chain
MNKKQIQNEIEEFTEGKDFKLNKNIDHVDMVINRLMFNEQKTGKRLCASRPSDGKSETDEKLTCPCDFKAQEEWTKLGRCHCGLFVKRQ